MRTDTILATAAAIEEHTIADLGFNMAEFINDSANSHFFVPDRSGHNCGTVACIAGWVTALFYEDGSPRQNPLGADALNEQAEYYSSDWHARAALDLTDEQSQALFYPGMGAVRSAITPDQAVRTLRMFAATGVIDWNLEKEAP